MSRATSGLAVAVALVVVLGCPLGDPGVRVALTREPVTLSGEPLVLSADAPLPAEAFFVGVCVFPGSGYHVSGRWTVLTPAGREALVVAEAELVNGDTVRLASPSSSGASLCVHPRRGGPFESPVRRVRLMASTPIEVERVVWRSGRP